MEKTLSVLNELVAQGHVDLTQLYDISVREGVLSLQGYMYKDTIDKLKVIVDLQWDVDHGWMFGKTFSAQEGSKNVIIEVALTIPRQG